jgi:hypothetical protein
MHTMPLVIPKDSNTFFTYTDNIYGIKLRYPHNWGGGLQIVAFYLPDVENKKILQAFLALSLLNPILRTIPLLDPGLHMQYCGHIIILHMEQENQWKSGQLLAVRDTL